MRRGRPVADLPKARTPPAPSPPRPSPGRCGAHDSSQRECQGEHRSQACMYCSLKHVKCHEHPSIDRLTECNATNATASNQSLTKAATDCWDLPAAGTAGLWSDGNVGCDGYVDNDWCEQFGAMDFAGFGTANAHCCACGGGECDPHAFGSLIAIG